MKQQDELIRELFNHEFTSFLELEEYDEVTDYATQVVEYLAGRISDKNEYKRDLIIEFSDTLNAKTYELKRKAFEAGVDNTLSLLGYQPAFNQSGNNQQTKDNG